MTLPQLVVQLIQRSDTSLGLKVEMAAARTLPGHPIRRNAPTQDSYTRCRLRAP